MASDAATQPACALQVAKRILRILRPPEGEEPLQALLDQVLHSLESAVNKASQQRQL